MRGRDLLEQVRRAITAEGERPATDRALARHLGVSITSLANWDKREDVTVKQMAGLLASAAEAARRRAQAGVISPIVEVFKIDRTRVGAGENFCIFSPGPRSEEHPYLAGLKTELGRHRGVYMFYDSRGRALYAGKTRSQTLRTEINFAYNRDRDLLRKKTLGS